MRAHAQAILRNVLFRFPLRPATLVLPRATLTDPALAHVGLTEAEARERHGNVRILRAPFAENDRAVLERDTAGSIKIVATPAGQILGVTILGRDAGELISLYALALARSVNLRGLADPLVPHPSRAEIGQAAILPAVSRDLTAGWVRRIIALLRQLG
jgi:pyruvate/2-oxoglutarate dehydrogenase complex dihydrolipoamide dehydrogenase (E3) component